MKRRPVSLAKAVRSPDLGGLSFCALSSAAERPAPSARYLSQCVWASFGRKPHGGPSCSSGPPFCAPRKQWRDARRTGDRPAPTRLLPSAPSGEGTERPHRCWLCMGTRADQYRRKADRARERAQQARDPFVKLSYQELGRDWAALAEQAEWLDSHQQPRPRASQLALVEHQVSMSGSDHELDFHRWKMQPNSGNGRSTGRNAPPPRLTPKGANVGKEWLTPGTTPPRRQRERLR
jgi:hypothetical protein